MNTVNLEMAEEMLGKRLSSLQKRILNLAAAQPTNRVILGTAISADRKELQQAWDALREAGILVDARLGRPGDPVVYRPAEKILPPTPETCPTCEQAIPLGFRK